MKFDWTMIVKDPTKILNHYMFTNDQSGGSWTATLTNRHKTNTQSIEDWSLLQPRWNRSNTHTECKRSRDAVRNWSNKSNEKWAAADQPRQRKSPTSTTANRSLDRNWNFHSQMLKYPKKESEEDRSHPKFFEPVQRVPIMRKRRPTMAKPMAGRAMVCLQYFDSKCSWFGCRSMVHISIKPVLIFST